MNNQPKGRGTMKPTLTLFTALLLAPLVALHASADDASLRRQLGSLRAAIDDLAVSFPGYNATEFRARWEELSKRTDVAAAGSEIERLRFDALVAANPLLKSKELLFVKRNAYGSTHYYDDHDNGIVRAGMGGNLCVLSLADGTVRELAPQLAGGLFDRCDLSFDGRQIVFGYCQAVDDGLRLWRVNADGSGLQQITFPREGETAEARAALSPEWRKPAGGMARDPQGNLSSRRFMSQDFHPCWLPDGGIAFTSTRAQQTVLCGDIGLSVPNLHRIEADGSGLRRLSFGTLNELCPTVLNDGRLLYNRWEYVFKSLFYVQPLWAMFPDGSRSEEIYGLNIGEPGVFTQGRAVPGRDDLVVCIGACHEQMAVGPVLLIDLHRDKRSPAAMHSLTPEVEARGPHHRWFLRDGKMVQDDGKGGPVFCDPFPLSDKFFLVAHNPDKPISDKAGYGLYLLDVFGNRVPIYRDPAISCWQPMLLQARPKPPVLGHESRRRNGGGRDAVRAKRHGRPAGHQAGHGEVSARARTSAARLGCVAAGRAERRRLRFADCRRQPQHPHLGDGTARHRAGACGWFREFHRAGQPQPVPPGARRELHAGADDADVREPPAGRTPLVHRLSRGPPPSAGQRCGAGARVTGTARAA